MRGADPESVRVLMQVERAGGSFDASVPALRYNSALGFTGTGQLASSIGPNAFTFRILRDSDSLVERMSGVQAKYERLAVANGRIRLGFEFDAYQDQYAFATLAALDSDSRPSSLGAGAYGSRLNYEPSATFVLATPLTLTVGLSFEQLNNLPTAARSESANAVMSTLRYHQRWSGSGDSDSGVGRRLQPARGHHSSGDRSGLYPPRRASEVQLLQPDAVRGSDCDRGRDLRPGAAV